jgi:UDP-N-acetylmuramate: L-alanyl-gamma-D-glutamyl-meso-diaminopimelate ligase
MNSESHYHFIAIGGAAMHNLALALKAAGHKVTGSDDEIFEPSKSRLASKGLLPEKMGWDENNITSGISAVILGMHAKNDNPELLKAQNLGLKIFSYPDFIYQHAKNKQRIVIAGSHGKTSITAMVLHVLKASGKKFDFMVGASIEGFETMVQLSEEAPIMIIEGDEYFTSPLDPTPKFLRYQHHIALISGVAWDHINVYPTLDSYVRQFDHLADSTPKGGSLIYDADDSIASVICHKERLDVDTHGYSVHKHVIKNGITHLITNKEDYAISVFGEHNLRNISGAKILCSIIGIHDDVFYPAISTFQGAKNRLEKTAANGDVIAFKDFAHAPSKVKATTRAVKTQWPKHKLTAVLELHTYSSLTAEFLKQYEGSLENADAAFIYYNPSVVAHKNLPSLNPAIVASAFKHQNMQVFTDSATLQNHLLKSAKPNTNLLIMTSGNFDGLDLTALSEDFLKG